ncbi:unnamed protein product [Owenia fusiformis]|uniref:Phenazine biosynthesis-like domain-containing protein n=1 Tax=Owenia fusiformis TaxID=6347 RepID=A0A8S4N678_OWEFU|nr:unnamed protein product [Owenia fusiformis]
MNISETAFITKITPLDSFKSSSYFGLRWFTPTNEVPLCGHATLASASALFMCEGNTSQKLGFKTLSGDLFATRDGNKIMLDLPLNPPEPTEVNYSDLIIAVIGDLIDVVKDIQYSATTKKLLIRLRDDTQRTALENITPNFEKMLELHTTGVVKGVGVTLKGSTENGAIDHKGQQYDFISRYFAPWVGINEDPVTGSAHTVLGPYWGKQLGKTELYARQCSKRGGDLVISIRQDGRVNVGGAAKVIIKGQIYV